MVWCFELFVVPFHLMNSTEEFLNFAKDVALESGKIMMQYFGKDGISDYKSDDSIVTIADKEVNSHVIKRVRDAYPTHAVEGEEESYVKAGATHIWVCDPIDGTIPFSTRIPVAMFSLALVINGELEIAVTYDPFFGDLYHATKGGGAYRNDKRITVNNIKLDDISCIGSQSSRPASLSLLSNIYEKLPVKNYTGLGSVVRASMAIADGLYTFYISYTKPSTVCFIDMAALILIVEESGGKVTDMHGNRIIHGKEFEGKIISNGIAHDELQRAISENCLKSVD